MTTSITRLNELPKTSGDQLVSSYQAKRLPSYAGISGWNGILPGRAAGNPLQQSSTADIVIIGAGFAGLSAARRLLLNDSTLDIAIVEAGELAQGSAGRNSGFMIDIPHDLASDDYAGESLENDRQQLQMNRAAISFASTAAEEHAFSRSAFNPCGKINGAATDKGHAHNLEFASHLSAIGEASETIDAQAMREITGSDYYRSGLYNPGTVMLQPAEYITALYNSFANELRLFEKSPVTRLSRLGETWQVTTDQGQLSAKQVILATNGHAESFGLYKNRLMHIFTYASMTEALTDTQAKQLGGQSEWGLTPADPMGATVRKIVSPQGHRIVVRSHFSCDPSMEVGEKRLNEMADLHRRQFDRRFPMLSEVNMQYVWGGQLCLSLNNVAAVAEVDQGLFTACCQNGLGLTKGTLAGMVAADMALDLDTVERRAIEAQPLPDKLPLPPFFAMAANTVMQWKEWRAGKEF